MYKKTTTNYDQLFIAQHLLGLQNQSTQGYQAAQQFKNKFLEEADQSQKVAEEAALRAILPNTYDGLQKLLGHQEQSFFDLSPIMQVAGLKGIMDVLSVPILTMYALYKGIETGIKKLQGLSIDEPEQPQINAIYASFLLRLKKTLIILTVLELIDPNEIEQKLKAKDKSTIYQMNSLVLLYLAFDSRGLEENELQLANGRILKKENCPSSGMALFEGIEQIKNLLKEILPGDHSMDIQVILKVIDKINAVIESDNKVNFQGELEENNENKIRQIGTTLSSLLKKDMEKLLKQADPSFAQSSSSIVNRAVQLTHTLEEQRTIASNLPNEEFSDPKTYEQLYDPVQVRNGIRHSVYNRKNAPKEGSIEEMPLFKDALISTSPAVKKVKNSGGK